MDEIHQDAVEGHPLPRQRLTRAAQLTLAAVLLLLACDTGKQQPEGATRSERQVIQREGEPDYIKAGYDEKKMDQAITQARASYMTFVKALQTRNGTMRGFAIKKGFRVKEEESAEHIWLEQVSFDGKRFTGTVANAPVETKQVKEGQRVSVAPSEISDWMYVENNVLRGGYTIRVIYWSYPADKRKQLEQQAGFRIE